MRRALGLAVALVVGLAGTCLAGAMYRNDSGSVARAIRIEFSEPAGITSMWPSFPQRDPQGSASLIVLSGGEVPAGGWFSFTWRPDSARVVKIEWLAQPPATFSVEEAEPLPDQVTELEVRLCSDDGTRVLEGTIRRTLSVNRLPFYVRYEASFDDSAGLDYAWSYKSKSHNVILPPPRLEEFCTGQLGYQQSPPPIVGVSGDSSRVVFTVLSNFFTYLFGFAVQDDAGFTYHWEDTEIDFLLHSAMPITLDATAFAQEQDIASVAWSAENGDPSDSQTFPIANPRGVVTTLMSAWPNVLEVTTSIEFRDGRHVEYSTEALIYFREGTPFPVRGTAVYVDMGNLRTSPEFEVALDEMYPLVHRLGMNSLTTAINWFYDSPDERGNFSIQPAWTPQFNCRTVRSDWLATFFERSKSEGLLTVVQYTPFIYPHTPDEYGWGRSRVTRGFFYGSGEGYENQLLHYLEMFIRHDVGLVFLGAESGDIEEWGGSLSREFFSSIAREYREQGFEGEVSYATCYSYHQGNQHPLHTLDHIYAPSQVGIPWQDMDYVGLTFYPKLSTRGNPTTQEMLEEASRQVQTYLVPLSRANRKPLFIEDFYGFAYEGMSMNPLIDSGGYAPEEQRRWTTAWLRALSLANQDRSNPLIAGLNFGWYWVLPNLNKACWPDHGVDEIRSVLNYTARRLDLQKLVMVYFRDVPWNQ